MVGKIQRLHLRDVWKHEARDFTTWLEDNVDVLNEVLDLEVSIAEREKSVGTFKLDLLAEDKSGHPVIIENQLGKSDHDHLGKVLTYLTNLEAKAAIWIVKDPRPEHINAITWLNESSSASFYLVKLEAIRIGDSEPAPLLTLIVGPSEEGKQIGETKKGIADRQISRQNFWKGLLQLARTKTKLHSNISPGNDNWIAAGSGKSGISFNYVINRKNAYVELYIDRGKDSEQENLEIFEKFKEKRSGIEKVFEDKLEWQQLDGKRACRIRYILDGGRDQEKKWPEIQNAMVDAMVRLENALKPHIKTLKG